MKELSNESRAQINKWLLSVSKTDKVDLVEFLLKSNTDVNVASEAGTTPLMNACSSGCLKMVKLLLKHGADVNAQDSQGYTSLHRAYDKIEIVKLLLKHGADVNAVDNNKKTTLMKIADNDGNPIIDVLVKAGANLEMKDVFGRTAIGIAVNYACEKNVKKFIKLGAKIDVLDSKGVDLLTCAAKQKRFENSRKIIAHLIKAGFNVNKRDSSGWTALMHASEVGSTINVRTLLNLGADINVRSNKKEWSALKLSLYRGHPLVAKEIILTAKKDFITPNERHEFIEYCKRAGFFGVAKMLREA